MGTESIFQIIEIIVCHGLVLEVGDGGIAVISEIAVMQAQPLKSTVFPDRMHMHLTDTLCLVSVSAEFFGEHVVIVPVDAVLIADTAVMFLALSGEECGSCRDTARAGRVGAVKKGAVRSERIKIRCLYVRMSCVGKTVPAELVAHKQ
jgi:hypothetical protein